MGLVKIRSIVTEYVNSESILEETGKTTYKVKPECDSLKDVIKTISEDINKHLLDGKGRTMFVTISTNKGKIKISSKTILKFKSEIKNNNFLKNKQKLLGIQY